MGLRFSIAFALALLLLGSGVALGAVIIGNAQDNRLVGTPNRDRIEGRKGDDDIFGRGSRDRLFGGAGADEVFGERGADRIRGGPGPDLLVGGKRRDIINAVDGEDNDSIRCGAGRDTAFVDPGEGKGQPTPNSFGCESVFTVTP